MKKPTQSYHESAQELAQSLDPSMTMISIINKVENIVFIKEQEAANPVA